MSSVNTPPVKKCKERLDDAIYNLCTSYLHLIEPREGWHYKKDSEIKELFDRWCEEEEVYLKVTDSGKVPVRTWTAPPPEDSTHVGCRAMWALRMFIDVDASGDEYLEDVVDLILEEPDCASHPASCPCRVPNNPWTKPTDVKILDRINVKHSVQCECAGNHRCAQQIPRVDPDALRKTEYLLIVQDINDQMNAMKKAIAWLHDNPGHTLPRTPCVCDSRWTNHCSCTRNIDYTSFMNTPTIQSTST